MCTGHRKERREKFFLAWVCFRSSATFSSAFTPAVAESVQAESEAIYNFPASAWAYRTSLFNNMLGNEKSSDLFFLFNFDFCYFNFASLLHSSVLN